MKNKIFYLLAFTVVMLNACKKNTDTLPDPLLASVTVVNATINVGPVKFNSYTTGISYAKLIDSIAYKAAKEYAIVSGDKPLSIVLYRDTTKKLYNNTFTFLPNSAYSLYLAGQSPNIKVFSFQDNIPIYQDSTAGIRFVNLAENSNPISVNLMGNASTQTEFTNLGYGQNSSFKGYGATSKLSPSKTYTFQIRDMNTGTLLLTYTWSLAVFKNNTIVISGLVNGTGTNALSTFKINNF